MGQPAPTEFTFAGGDASTPVRLNLADLRERRTRDGRHLWVVGLLYRVADPEVALDDMTLGAHNLVGAVPITCMWCRQHYRTPLVPEPTCHG